MTTTPFFTQLVTNFTAKLGPKADTFFPGQANIWWAKMRTATALKKAARFFEAKRVKINRFLVDKNDIHVIMNEILL